MEHLSPTQAMVVAMYGPSGLLKIVAPQWEKTTFPRLPDWFWLPCGLWEVFGMMALVFWDMSALGLFMRYTFMGLLIPVLPMLFGWAFGAYLQRQSRQKDSVHPEKRYF